MGWLLVVVPVCQVVVRLLSEKVFPIVVVATAALAVCSVIVSLRSNRHGNTTRPRVAVRAIQTGRANNVAIAVWPTIHFLGGAHDVVD